MQHELRFLSQAIERFAKHVPNQAIARAAGHFVGHDFAVVQIHHGRQIELLLSYFELGYVSHPLLVWALSDKISLQYIRCHFADGTSIGAIFLGAHY
ncbi:hypothetical protein D3C76_959410 [compost metagenome]